MRSILLITIVSSFVLSCARKDTAAEPPSSLVGKWVLTAQKVGIGAPGVWQEVTDGSALIFNTDGTFSGITSDCASRSYRATQEAITFTFDCPDDIVNRDTLGYRIIASAEDYMIITPTTYICMEGCEYKYTRAGGSQP